jgi:multidrug efflux system outer membrane protein
MKWTRTLGLGLVTGGLAANFAVDLDAGLAVGPDYRRPSVPVSTNFADAEVGTWKEAAPADAIARGAWWTIFNDPVLDDLERTAALNNQDLKAAVARITQARAVARHAKADFFPALALEPSAFRSRTSANALNSMPNQLGNDFRVPMDLTYELDLWGRVRRSFEAANAEAQGQVAAFENTLLVLKADVALNYWALRTLDTERAILRDTLQLRRDALDLVTARFNGGAASELDVSRAQTELNATDADLLAAERNRAEIEHALALLLGSPASDFRVKELPFEANTLPPVIPAGLPGELIERRPDIAEAERALAAANARIGVAKAAFFPVVRLTGIAGFESMDVETLFNWQSRVWSIGPSITLPVFQGGRNRANLKRSRAAFEENVALYRQRVLVAFKEVQDALTGARLLSQQAAAQERSRASARRTADLSNIRYRAGLVSYLEVVESERTALNTERESARLTGQRLVTSVQLIKALGGGWADSALASLDRRATSPSQGEQR